jgi:voltage-gated potassium channel Kch
MAKGLKSVILLLVLATLVLVAIVSFFVVVFRLYPESGPIEYPEAFWLGMLRTLDAGTMGSDQGFGFRAAMLVITLLGVVLVATLIGAISNWFTERAIDLRKGRSKVLVNNHTLILGWNSKVFTLINEICLANASENNATIVVLADRDKVEMEDLIASHVKHKFGSRVIVRSGDPMSLVDLEITNHSEAKSVVILPPDDVEDPDSVSIKTALALINNKNRKEGKYHIVGVISDLHNLEAAHLVGGDEVAWIVGEDLIARLIVQTSRQSGLSAVFTELLDFEGSEIYEAEYPELTGKTYAEIATLLEDGVLIGFVDQNSVQLNPAPGSALKQGQKLIVIAEDNSAIKIGKSRSVDSTAFAEKTSFQHSPEKTLILGANENLTGIISEMANYQRAGSSITIVTEYEVEQNLQFDGIQLSWILDDPADRRCLSKLDVTSFDHVVVLTDSNRYSHQHADARTLMTLLHLRELAKKDDSRINIVSEMLDDRNRELAESTHADDFIVSNKLVSLMMAQVEENPELTKIFKSLFSSEGSEIMLHPAEWYVKLGVPVTFDQVVASALRMNESAIGFNMQANATDNLRTYGVTLSPARDKQMTFQPGDKVVVLSEN